MVASVTSDRTRFQPETAKEVFRAPVGFNGSAYEVSSNGERFLLYSDASATETTADSPLTVVVNWRALLRR